jgi:uncharacterized RDD family membrane protein YckC
LQCSKCNHHEMNGSKFCTNCGELLSATEEKTVINFCPGCGNKKESDAKFCSHCGYHFEGLNLAFKENATTGYQRYQNTSYQTTVIDEASYATFGQRVLALLIDSFLLFVYMLFFVFVFLSDSYNSEGSASLWGFIFGLAYKAGMESSTIQGTLGKKAMGIKVVDLQGNRISFLRSLGRFFGTYLSGIILCIGYLMPLFTEKRQTLHDMIASTIVVKK